MLLVARRMLCRIFYGTLGRNKDGVTESAKGVREPLDQNGSSSLLALLSCFECLWFVVILRLHPTRTMGVPVSSAVPRTTGRQSYQVLKQKRKDTSRRASWRRLFTLDPEIIDSTIHGLLSSTITITPFALISSLPTSTYTHPNSRH